MKGKLRITIGLLTAAAMIITSAAALMVPTAVSAEVTSEAYNWKNVQIGGGGYVDNVIFNPGEKDLIYARTDMGGAYRWNPSTGKWIPLMDTIGFDDWNNLGCDSLAVDPVDTNRVYIAAGTYTNNWAVANGCILRSTDKGDTWEVTNLPFKCGANMMGRSMGERLVVDPNSNNVLYMGTRNGNGLWKSTDYGVTWSKVSTFTEVGNIVPTDLDPTVYDNTITGVVWVTFDPASSTAGTPCNKIYVGVVNKAKNGEAPKNTVFYTANGGLTWSAVAGQPKDGYFPHHGVLSSEGILYIPYSNGVGPYDGSKGDVWKYNTGTGVWTKISPVPSSSEDNYYGYGGLSVDAQDPDTLIVTTLNSWWPDANIFRSRDGGATWTRFWDWNGYPDRTIRFKQDISVSPWLTFGKQYIPPDAIPKMGWMMGNIAIDPFNSDRMMYGTGATVYGTDNLTAIDSGGLVNISVKSVGIEQTAVLSLISPDSGTAHLVSGLGDLCGFVHTDLTKIPAMMMITPNFTSTTSMDFAQLNPTRYVRVGNTDAGTNPRIGISYDSGNNWSAGTNSWSSNSSDTTEGGKVAMSADGNTIVWAPAGKAPSYSTTSGSSWTACAGLPVNAFVASDRVNSNKFYGYSGGTFYVSTNKGATFTATATGLPDPSSSPSPETTPVNFKAMPGIEGDIWLAGGSEGYDYGLWHSTNSGATFTRLDNVEEADVVGFGMAAPGADYMALYICAQINGVRGIFRSTDAGASWVRINDDSHQYGRINMCITGDPRIFGRVYVGTNGRGIIYGDTTATPTVTPTPTATPTPTVTPTPTATPTVTPTVTPTATPTPTNSASISPGAAAFDKNTTLQADITVTLTPNGNTLSAIKNGSKTLTAGTDYTVSGNTVVIKKAYLSSLSVGSASLTFDFSGGTDPVLSLVISDSTGSGSSGLTVQMYNNPLTASTQSIAPQFKLINNGTSAISLEGLKLRYYYTDDGAVSQNFWCDWSSVGAVNVTGAFVDMTSVKTTADCYLEITISAGAGSLSPGSSAFIQTRFSKSDWSNYTQTNDYSFNSSGTSYGDWSKVTAYQNGSLVWGVEP